MNYTAEDALELWRGAARQVGAPTMPEAWRRDYELAAGAVCVTLAALGARTMQELLTLYYHPRGEGRLEPAIRGAIDEVQRGNGGARYLNWGIVEDLGFWLRARHLIEQSGEGGTTDVR